MTNSSSTPIHNTATTQPQHTSPRSLPNNKSPRGSPNQNIDSLDLSTQNPPTCTILIKIKPIPFHLPLPFRGINTERDKHGATTISHRHLNLVDKTV